MSYTTQSSRRRPRIEREQDAPDPATANADFLRGVIAIVVVFGLILWIVKTFVA